MAAQYTFTPVANDGETCFSSRMLSGTELDNLSGTLRTGDTPGIQPANYCGSSSPENIEWYSFLVSDPDVHIEIEFTGCAGGVLFDQGFQAGVYRGCDFVNDDIICVSQTNVNGTIVLQFTTAPGIHYMFMDGFAGSVCDYEVNVITGICQEPYTLLNTPDSNCRPIDSALPDQDTVTICLGNEQSIRPDLDFPPIFDNCDVLSSSFSSVVNGEPFYSVQTVVTGGVGHSFVSGEYVQISYTSPRGTIINEPTVIRWDTPGTYSVSQVITANPYLPSSHTYDTSCSGILTVIVEPYDTMTLAADTICFGETYPFCGSSYMTSQEILCDDAANCIITKQPLIVLPQAIQDLGTIYLCADSCFTIYGTDYCTAGSYQDDGSNFCDTLYEFTIETLELSTSVDGDTVLTCAREMTTLTGNITTAYLGPIEQTWITAAGDTVSQQSDLVTTMADTYTYIAQPIGYPCYASSTTHVVQDVDTPSIVMVPPTLNCNIGSGEINTTTTDPISTYQWTGPSGYTSNVSQPTVSDTGAYHLILTGSNGCMLDTSVTVAADYEAPLIMLSYQDLDCNITQGTASYSAADIVADTWLLPTGGVAVGSTLTYSDSGSYTLILEASNGCTADSIFSVSDLTHDPTIGMDKDSVWQCNTTQIDYAYSSSPDYTIAWTTANGQLAQSAATTMRALDPGTYIAEINDVSTGCIGWDTVTILPDTNALQVLWYGDDPSCYGYDDGSIHLDILSGQSPYDILVNETILTQADMGTLAAGSYSVQVTDQYGCQRDTTFVLEDPLQVIITSDPDIVVQYAEETTLQVEHTVPDERLGFITWVDSDGQLLSNTSELVIVGQPSAKYGVAVQDVNGCMDSIELRVIVDSNIEIWAPTIFSPDGDSNNDLWYLSTSGSSEALISVRVYARWGELVYSQEGGRYEDESYSWDGTYAGQQCPPGVYVYRTTYLDPQGEQQSVSGTITLVR